MVVKVLEGGILEGDFEFLGVFKVDGNKFDICVFVF